jgi:hypothetical protein
VMADAVFNDEIISSLDEAGVGPQHVHCVIKGGALSSMTKTRSSLK